jgi:hypothetical protein
MKPAQSLKLVACSLAGALTKVRWAHAYCEDTWYCCPKHPEYSGQEDVTDCNCGADENNAIIDAALEDWETWKSEHLIRP